VLPEAFATDAERLQRFEQEARATAALSHPHNVSLYDVGRYDGAPARRPRDLAVLDVLERSLAKASKSKG
jgi:serine/threonine protein kinase